MGIDDGTREILNCHHDDVYDPTLRLSLGLSLCLSVSLKKHKSPLGWAKSASPVA